MTRRVMYGTPVDIPNYNGTCLRCGNHIYVREVRGVFLSENTTNFSKRILITSGVYCPTCRKFITHVELYSAWEPSMFARCN